MQLMRGESSRQSLHEKLNGYTSMKFEKHINLHMFTIDLDNEAHLDSFDKCSITEIISCGANNKLLSKEYLQEVMAKSNATNRFCTYVEQ